MAKSIKPFANITALINHVRRLQELGANLGIRDEGDEAATVDAAEREAFDLSQPRTVRVWIHQGIVSDVHGLPKGVTLRIIDLDTEGADASDGVKTLKGDDKLAAGGIAKGFVTTFEEDTEQ